MKHIIYILGLISFISCSNSDIDFERASLIVNNQKIELLTANEIFENYLIKKSDYLSNVISHIENEFLENAEYPFIIESIKTEITPDEKLFGFTEKIKNIDFKKLTEPFLNKIIAELPGPDTKILFIPSNPAFVDFFRNYQIGVTAITVGTGKIIVSIDPTSNNWQEQLPYVLAHEYHHSVWTSRNFKTKDFTPLEYLIFEGRADSFAKQLYPEVNSPWTNMINQVEEKKVWKIIKPELNKRETKMNDLMMIGNDEIPYCSGYTIGFNIVKKFKENNPNINDKSLIDMEPEIILELSEYEK
ncbi:DUF2268 domain-containing putative Zn-dependent protease [Draconibacterium sp.]|uniref:DUF2268 domain-containing putative Zn-dependent protease n=1 Tax=Draconibacterium sp. TaxID=1965318 RepID=UPI0035677A2D